jgi:hypothetical protein
VNGRIWIKVHVLGQPSPEGGLDRGGDKATSGEFSAWAANATAPVIAGHASAASATSQSRLNRYTITFFYGPAPSSFRPYFLDYANWLMARDQWKFQAHGVELTVVLVNVAAAQATGLNSYYRIVGAYMRNFEILHLVFTRPYLNSRSRFRHYCHPRSKQPAAIAKVSLAIQNLELFRLSTIVGEVTLKEKSDRASRFRVHERSIGATLWNALAQ